LSAFFAKPSGAFFMNADRMSADRMSADLLALDLPALFHTARRVM
jgi:hypothetical protein